MTNLCGNSVPPDTHLEVLVDFCVGFELTISDLQYQVEKILRMERLVADNMENLLEVVTQQALIFFLLEDLPMALAKEKEMKDLFRSILR